MNLAEKIVILQRVEKDLKLIIAFNEAGDSKLIDESLKYMRVIRGRVGSLTKEAVKADAEKVRGK